MRLNEVSLELVELLITKLKCRVDFEVLKEALRLERFDLLGVIVKNADEDMFERTKVRHPNILVRVSDLNSNDFDFNGQEGVDLIFLFVNKFGIDVNYKEGVTGSTLLHNLVRRYDASNKSSLELILGFDNLDINDAVKVEAGNCSQFLDMSALDVALHYEKYEVAELLIKNFADTTKLAPIKMKTENGFPPIVVSSWSQVRLRGV